MGEVLDNDALPEVLAPFPAQWLTVAEVTDRETLDAYYQSTEFAEARSQLAPRVSNEVQVVMQLEPAQPGVPQFPLLGGVRLREQPPAFLVLNAVGFLPDPAVPERITQFVATSGPLLMAEETTFLATMQKVDDLEGSYASQARALYVSAALRRAPSVCQPMPKGSVRRMTPPIVRMKWVFPEHNGPWTKTASR